MEHIEAYGFKYIYNHLAVRLCLRVGADAAFYQNRRPVWRRHPVFFDNHILGSNRPVDEIAMSRNANGREWGPLDGI